MKESFRWYGENLDPIQLSDIRQTGARGIVTSLHEIPYGEVWSRDAIAARKSLVEAAGFTWDVVESLPLHDAIKTGDGNLELLFANYRQSMANLAAEGVRTICYNFMPLLDWTRTDLKAPVAGGGTCLRFDAAKMAAFDVHILEREYADKAHTPEALDQAKAWYSQSSEDDRQRLIAAVMSGMPGAFDLYDLTGLREALKRYSDLTHADLRANLKRFLDAIVPAAEDLGVRLCIHPDDPPKDILGLPRIASSGADIDLILAAHDSQANGLTLCSGSLGAHPENDVVEIASRHAERIHFAHLRNVCKDPDGSFEEAAHLDGDTDMVALVHVLIEEEKRRTKAGRANAVIPFRPDHGHELLSDLDADAVPGYPLIGRLRGLAELRGVRYALGDR
ncbi:Mannonate dehydratase [Cognatishimia activa]|uniref:Mannonate dehydratase n=1 Tax=Cognatishimia activa TaxID=1715691 RepID=A0A0P1IV18_9RHOB|nr:mannonate dehydratase [Cognatishimia activa]CUK27491.1 Mannonate dehydratase [Cognatishimia activa]